MNEKFEDPTLEQLRALLSGHPDLLNHIKSEKALDRAGREKLLELVELCGLSIDQVDKSDPHGLLRGLKNKRGRDTAAGRTNPDGFLQGDKDDPTYGQDADFVPFQITIEALGHKMHYSAFLEYQAEAYVKKNKIDDGWDIDRFTCENAIKILSYTDMPEPGYKTSREIQPVLLDNPSINELFPEKAHDEILDQIEDELLAQIVSELNFSEDKSSEDQAGKESTPNDKPEINKE